MFLLQRLLWFLLPDAGAEELPGFQHGIHEVKEQQDEDGGLADVVAVGEYIRADARHAEHKLAQRGGIDRPYENVRVRRRKAFLAAGISNQGNEREHDVTDDENGKMNAQGGEPPFLQNK